MSRTERLKVVQSVAEHEEREECRKMGHSQKILEEKMGRLEELNAYRHAYSLKSKPKNGLSALQWQDYQKFIGRLDEAVVTQEQLVRESRTQQQLHQNCWMKKRQRLESLTRIVDRYKIAEFEATERRLAKIQDSQPIRQSPYEHEH